MVYINEKCQWAGRRVNELTIFDAMIASAIYIYHNIDYYFYHTSILVFYASSTLLTIFRYSVQAAQICAEQHSSWQMKKTGGIENGGSIDIENKREVHTVIQKS